MPSNPIPSHPFPPSISNHSKHQKPHSRQTTQTIKNHTHAKNLPIHQSINQSINQSPTTNPKRIRLVPIHPSIHPSYPTGSLPLPATATATVASSALRRGDAGLRGEMKRVPIWIWVRCSEAGVGVRLCWGADGVGVWVWVWVWG